MSRRLHPKDEKQMEATWIAVLIDVGWIASWPLEWTKTGAVALRRGLVRQYLTRLQDRASTIDGRLILAVQHHRLGGYATRESADAAQ